MSLAGKFFKGGIMVVAVAGIGWSYGAYSQAKNSVKANTAMLAYTKQQYRHVSHVKPTRKRVTSNYQRALNCGRDYLKLSDKLHQLGDIRGQKARNVFKQMQSMYKGTITGPMVDFPIKDWHGSVSYGGQTGSGKVLVTFKFVNNKNQLMKIVTCYYHPDTNKLSGMTSYMSKAGLQANRDVLTSWGVDQNGKQSQTK